MLPVRLASDRLPPGLVRPVRYSPADVQPYFSRDGEKRRPLCLPNGETAQLLLMPSFLSAVAFDLHIRKQDKRAPRKAQFLYHVLTWETPCRDLPHIEQSSVSGITVQLGVSTTLDAQVLTGETLYARLPLRSCAWKCFPCTCTSAERSSTKNGLTQPVFVRSSQQPYTPALINRPSYCT